MPDGTKIAVREEHLEGDHFRPLLSNIVLNELDDELARRGLRFVRYADDCNLFVRSERAGKRVMASNFGRFWGRACGFRWTRRRVACGHPMRFD